MTEVISKERLLEIAKAPINKNNEELQFILRWLITTECKELDPWLLIENAPLNRRIRLFTKYDLRQVDGTLYFDDDKETYTHYKLVPEDPK